MKKSKPKSVEGIEGREILTRTQMIAFLQVSPTTLNKLVKREGLPHFRIGKKILFVKADVLSYLKSRPKS